MVRWKKLLNFVCFQVGWFACALGGARLAAAGTAGGRRAPDSATSPGARSRQASSFCAGSNVGRLVDRQRACPRRCAYLSGRRQAPWALPSLDGRSLGELRGHASPVPRLVTRALLAGVGAGACGGPLAYYGGQRLGAMQLGSNTAISLAGDRSRVGLRNARHSSICRKWAVSMA